MPTVEFYEGDGAMRDAHIVEALMGERVWRVIYLPGGMKSGAPSVSIGVQRDDGTWVLVETSAKAFLTAAAAISGIAQRRGDDTRYDVPRLGVG